MLEIVFGNLFAKAAKRTLGVSTQRVRDVVLFRLEGRISIDGGGAALRDLVTAALDRGDRKILLNLSGISFIDSSGIAELVAAYSEANTRGGALRLCCLSDKVFTILQMTALLQVFDVRECEADGVAAFDAAASA